MLEYLNQSNNNADHVNPEDGYKLFDDLTVLEVVNLFTIGLTSFNLKFKVPNDIPIHNQYLPPEQLKSQETLNEINDWTVRNKKLINQKKSETNIFKSTVQITSSLPQG